MDVAKDGAWVRKLHNVALLLEKETSVVNQREAILETEALLPPELLKQQLRMWEWSQVDMKYPLLICKQCVDLNSTLTHSDL